RKLRGQASHHHDSHRHDLDRRSRTRRARAKPRPTGRKYHRQHHHWPGRRCQAAADSQGGYSNRLACSLSLESGQRLQCPPTRRDTSCGTEVRFDGHLCKRRSAHRVRDRFRSKYEGAPRCVRDDRRTSPPDPYRMDHGLHGEEPAAGSVSIERERARRGVDVLRREPARLVPARSRLRAQNFAGQEARRPTGGAAGQIRAGRQPQDRQGDRAYVTAWDSCPRRRGDRVKRRDFITLLGGAAAAWPFAARAQQDGRVPLLGWLDAYDDRMRTALHEALAKLGWIEGRNLKIDRRFGAADADRLRNSAVELVSLAPDVIVAGGAAPTRALQQATQTIPIVFTGGGDAAAIGLVENFARPEGNITGFSSSEPMIGGKWLELLKEAEPHLKKVAIVFNPDVAPSAPNYIASIETAAQTLSVKTVKVPFHDAIELVRSIDAFAGEPNGGMLILPPPYTAHRAAIFKLAMQHRLPAMYAQGT